MSFGTDLSAFAKELETRNRDVFVAVVAAVEESIKIGSPVTSAPGQPVEFGTLRNSWTTEIDGDRAQVSTPMEYAPPIEDGVGAHGPLRLRSGVGGFHSVKLTEANFDRLVEKVTAEVTGHA